MRIWKTNGKSFELECNVQGAHERNIYTVSWSEHGILTGAGDNKIRLFIEESDHTWVCHRTVELQSDINSGSITVSRVSVLTCIFLITVAWCGKTSPKAAAATDDGEVVILSLQ